MDSIFLIAICFFTIAFLYSSVGFGGGSSYLALLALFFVSIAFIRSTALLCNLAVVSGSVFFYWRKGILHFRKFLPFIITSVPLAYLGARFKLSDTTFFILLGFTLLLAAALLIIRSVGKIEGEKFENYPKPISWCIGGAIGFLAGLVGIGGGIFLAPALNLMRWDKPKVIAALASFFILANSVSGLVGLWSANNLVVNRNTTPLLLLAVILGGQLGLRLSLKWFSGNYIRIITALLIAIVGIRILINQFHFFE